MGQNGRERRRFAGLVGAGAVIGVAAAVAGCGGSSRLAGPTAASSSPTATGSAPQASTSTPAHRVAGRATSATPAPEINLLSPSGNNGTAAIAEVVKQGNKAAIAIVGHGLPANTKHNAYAVWLYNAPDDSALLGFVNPGVGKDGRIETTGPLPSNAAHFRQLLITVETISSPTKPGEVILRGTLTGV